MNFCANCGGKLANEMKFCPSCGANLNSSKKSGGEDKQGKPNMYSNGAGAPILGPDVSIEWFVGIVRDYSLRLESNLNSELGMWRESFRTFTALYGEDKQFWPRDLGEPPPTSVPTEVDLSLLTAPVSKIKKISHQRLLEIHNFAVNGLREELQIELQSNSKTVKVREGLIVPLEWDAHYRILHESQPEVLIWLAVRHAFVGNPLAGEVLEWSPSVADGRKTRQSTKLIGAAAIGAVAALLLGA
jgi:hypothetical protein